MSLKKTTVKELKMETPKEKIFKPEFSEQEYNALAQIVDLAVKATGIAGNTYANGTFLLNKILQSEVK